MSNRHITVLALLLAGASLGAAAQTVAEHEQHHPQGAAAPTAPAAAQPAMPPNAMGPGRMVNMASKDEHIKAMRAMHDKMAAARTPEERQALMAEHVKLMQEGMGMMEQMGAGMPADLAARHQLMEKRIEMMESMMKMMMDRLPPAR